MDGLDEADAMAAAMGFSSFGTQPSAKRRKYNPHTDDAFVAASSQPSGQPANHGKGSNAIPLGNRPAPAPAQAPNKDEISLDLDDDDDDGDDEPAPQYIDTSRPSAPVELASTSHPDPVVQARIDEIVGSTDPLPPPQGHQGGGHGGFQSRGQPRGMANHAKSWWEDYYDPATNMNPWEKLEKEMGLTSLSNDYLTWEESKASWEKIKNSTTQQDSASA